MRFKKNSIYKQGTKSTWFAPTKVATSNISLDNVRTTSQNQNFAQAIY